MCWISKFVERYKVSRVVKWVSKEGTANGVQDWHKFNLSSFHHGSHILGSRQNKGMKKRRKGKGEKKRPFIISWCMGWGPRLGWTPILGHLCSFMRTMSKVLCGAIDVYSKILDVDTEMKRAGFCNFILTSSKYGTIPR